MPTTTKSITKLRPELATFEQLDHEMQIRGYIGTELLPAFEVSERSGSFGVVTLKSLLAAKDADTKRTARGGYNRGDFEFTDRDFATSENGWEEPVDEREANMYDSFFDLEEMSTQRAWEHLLNSLERRIFDTLIGAITVAGQTTAATAVWTNLAGSDPITDISAMQDKIWQRTGLWPRTMALSRRNFRLLRRNEKVKEEIRSSGAGKSTEQVNVTTEMLKEVLDLDKIVIADAIKNTNNPGQAAASVSSVFPEDQVFLGRTAETNDFKEPCVGRLFHWGGDGSRLGDGKLIGVVERYEEPQTRKDIVRVRHETQEFMLYTEMGEMLTGVR